MNWGPPAPRRLLFDLLGGTHPYDAFVRAVRTFAQAFTGALLASAVWSVPVAQAAAFAGLTAAVTYVHGLLGR